MLLHPSLTFDLYDHVYNLYIISDNSTVLYTSLPRKKARAKEIHTFSVMVMGSPCSELVVGVGFFAADFSFIPPLSGRWPHVGRRRRDLLSQTRGLSDFSPALLAAL